MLKKYVIYLLFIILVLYPKISQSNEPMVLQCEKFEYSIQNILSKNEYSLYNTRKWKITDKYSFYIVHFKQDKNGCMAYPVYAENATYSTVEAFYNESECESGIYGKGFTTTEISLNNMYLYKDIKNTYISDEQCIVNIHYVHRGNDGNFLPWSKRSTCELSKKHFYKSITDNNYSSDAQQVKWQNYNCKQITKEKFEKITKLKVDKF